MFPVIGLIGSTLGLVTGFFVALFPFERRDPLLRFALLCSPAATLVLSGISVALWSPKGVTMGSLVSIAGAILSVLLSLGGLLARRAGQGRAQDAAAQPFEAYPQKLDRTPTVVCEHCGRGTGASLQACIYCGKPVKATARIFANPDVVTVIVILMIAYTLLVLFGLYHLFE